MRGGRGGGGNEGSGEEGNEGEKAQGRRKNEGLRGNEEGKHAQSYTYITGMQHQQFYFS